MKRIAKIPSRDSVIFTVTGLDFTNGKTQSKRCFGYRCKLFEAQQDVADDVGGLHEHRYNYIVIEKHMPHLWNISMKRWWYKWKNGKWTKCSCPRGLGNVINFGIG